ncbi:acetate--CoA ligase family protein [Vibrio nigripulchritudo]|uniref:acetate--CoA ligase family protein n=1 Tax=Vibrio nigripulchritudo TaxID=28173 RepID=UPI002490C4BD|nr:acetate--CoA ligase family protein [Vibrio nigripulchritudo]BDU39673.1 hypothetical protein TUMSATVNIG2_41420 [Vibrio nigripulchritudo]BDU45396.1 hypothetical protein TUMSATVNIG3_41940 [Vibrio nigripulchritudo]
MTRVENIQRLLSPKSIVFIGGQNLTQPLENIRTRGFDGDVWVVNPKYSDVAGFPCYRSISELPGSPDAAFVSVNAELSVEVVSLLRLKGCGGVVCYAAGFAEAGSRGERLQEELVRQAGDMAVVGPNCYGLLNFTNGVTLWPDRVCGDNADSGVAIISQSGNVALNLTMNERSVPFTHVISVGNQAVMDVCDFVTPLLDNPKVRAIGIYLEGLKDVSAFSKVAIRAATKGVPLIVFKAGTSDVGTQLTMSHTSSLSGSDDMYQAMFERLGVIRVYSLSELLETLKIASICKLPRTQRVSALTCSGGDSTMLADRLDKHDVLLPGLSQAQIADLNSLLPEFASISNPLDYNTAIWGDRETCTKVFKTVMSGDFDVSILMLDFPDQSSENMTEWNITVDALIDAHLEVQKTTVVICNLSELLPENIRKRLINAGIAPLQGLQDGVSALANLIGYSQKRQALLKQTPSDTLVLRKASSLNGISESLNEWDSKQLLRKYGLSIPLGKSCALEEVSEASEKVGFPVVLKGVSEKLIHKTESGAVALNLTRAVDCETAANTMANRLNQCGIADYQFMVEPMIRDTVAEMIVGLKRDEQFGLALVVGSGGILVNLIHDSRTLLLPTNQVEIEEAIKSLRGSQLLYGYRNQKTADIEALIDAVMAVSEFAMAHWDQIEEVDINPILVRPAGKGVVAADAFIKLVMK